MATYRPLKLEAFSRQRLRQLGCTWAADKPSLEVCWAQCRAEQPVQRTAGAAACGCRAQHADTHAASKGGCRVWRQFVQPCEVPERMLMAESAIGSAARLGGKAARGPMAWHHRLDHRYLKASNHRRVPIAWRPSRVRKCGDTFRGGRNSRAADNAAEDEGALVRHLFCRISRAKAYRCKVRGRLGLVCTGKQIGFAGCGASQRMHMVYCTSSGTVRRACCFK